MKTRNRIGAVWGLVGLLSGCVTSNNSSQTEEISAGLARTVNSLKTEVVDSPYVQEMRAKHGCVGVGRSSLEPSSSCEADSLRNARMSYIMNCLDYPPMITLITYAI